MLHRITTVGALALVAACADRTPITAPGGTAGPPAAALSATSKRPEALARIVAQGLKNPAFRAYLKAQLDASPYREHKLQFQTFLGANGGRALRQIADANGISGDDLAASAHGAIALEVYFPVHQQRTAWQGDENILVATALTDDDPPVAFDPGGRRQVLDVKQAPATPVLALVPQETDFTARPDMVECLLDCDGTGSGGTVSPPPPPPAPGLYMTKSHFVQTFEGWLKGDPEFEVHILGQKGQSDSLIDYQCAGEHAGGPYAFDQNNLDWSGRVLLFSKDQLDAYNAAHPNQNVRVFVVEDDDTACEIKTDPQRFQNLFHVVDSIYNRLTSGNDSSTSLEKYWGFARAGYNFFQRLASWFKSNDELVGDAVKDQIVGYFYPGYNWFVKGENNITNGWIDLEVY